MSEFCFNVKQEILTKNIEEFAKRAAKYGVRYTVHWKGHAQAKSLC